MDSLIKNIKEHLIGNGFESTDEIIYIKTSEVSDSPNIILVNGQKIVRPGAKHLIKYLIELIGQGFVSEIDKDDEKSLLIDFLNLESGMLSTHSYNTITSSSSVSFFFIFKFNLSINLFIL